MADDFPLDVQQLVTVLDHLNMGVYVTDCERRIILWNRKAEEITGYLAKDIVGKACHEQVLCHVDGNGNQLCFGDLCPLLRAIRLGKESEEPELVFALNAQGQRVAVTVSVAPLRDPSGKIVGGIETFRDETARIRDLEFARKIQQHLLPDTLPKPAHVRFDVHYHPHDLVGGDFYDIRQLSPNQFGVLVADVRGHGVSAALYTMWLKSLEEQFRALSAAPEEFVSALNRELGKYVVDESFATALYGVLDAEQRTFRYCSAGHPAPLHFQAGDKQVTELETHGLPLGIMPDADYGVGTAHLKTGDLLLCYTDGVTEIVDQQGRMFGSHGLAALLPREIAAGPDHLLARIFKHITDTCGTVSLPDDVLLLSLLAEQA